MFLLLNSFSQNNKQSKEIIIKRITGGYKFVKRVFFKKILLYTTRIYSLAFTNCISTPFSIPSYPRCTRYRTQKEVKSGNIYLI